MSKKTTKKIKTATTATTKTTKNPLKKLSAKKLSIRSKKLIEKGRKYYTHAYKPRDMIVAKGRGATVFDLDGNSYIDLGAGIAVTSLGHQNAALRKALINQAGKIWHTSNMFFTEPPVNLAEMLVKSSKFARRVFLTNSGAEANEAAIKLARKYAADKGRPPEKRRIITFTGSFHGRTLATVTATAQPKYQQGYEPLPGGFVYVNFNDIEAFKQAMDDSVCAVMCEVVQGEGGITPVKPGFLQEVQNLCRKYDALLMLDQVQCGMMRTGHLFSHFAEKNVVPDVVTLAKALGGGMPIGACLIGERAENTFQFGSHGSTFGGNPLACAVACEVLKILQSKKLRDNVAARSKEFFAGLKEINAKTGIFREIRGRGLMVGAELAPHLAGKAGDIAEAARAGGVLILQAGPNVLRFLPPLTINSAELKEGLKRLSEVLLCLSSAR